MDDESDTEIDVSGGKQDSESDELSKMHEEDAETEGTSNAVESEEQVQCFVSVEEFESAVKHLRRVPISELDLESDLEQGYVGGHVIAQCFGDLSQQGHLELVVSDRSQAKNVTCYISGPLSEMLPALNHGYLLFLSRVEVKSMHSEFSQDHSECVVAEGTRPRVWVVHKDVKRKHIVKWGQKYQKMKSKQANKAKAGKGIATGHQAIANNDKALDRGEDRQQTTSQPTSYSTLVGSGRDHPHQSPRKVQAQTTPQPISHSTPADGSGREHPRRSPRKSRSPRKFGQTQTTPQPISHSTPPGRGPPRRTPRKSRSPRKFGQTRTTPQASTHSTPPSADGSDGEHPRQSPRNVDPRPTPNSTLPGADGLGGEHPRRSLRKTRFPRKITQRQTTPQPRTRSTPERAGGSDGADEGQPCQSPRNTNPQMQGGSMCASVSAREKEAHTSQISATPEQITFPDNFDLPDSAFDEYDALETDSGEDRDFVLLVPKSSSESIKDSSDETEDEDWKPKKVKVGDTGRLYTYTKIANLKPYDEKVNVFAVVKDFHPPAKSRGTDYYLTMTIVDESSPEEGVHCNIFNRQENRLPHVRSVGDIVCLHRMYVNEYGGEPQLVSRKYSSAICFDGRAGTKIVPRTGSVSYTFASEEYDRVKELKEWSLQQTEDSETAKQMTSSHTVQHQGSEQEELQMETEWEQQQIRTVRTEQQMETEREEQQMETEREEQQIRTVQTEQRLETEQEEQLTREQEDQQTVSEQRDQQSETPQQHRGKRICKLESVTPNLCFDLVCQVVSISSCFKPSGIMLTVWDGTRMLMETPAINTSWCSTTTSPVMLLNSSGLLQNVAIYTKQCAMMAKNIVPGQYVFLRNIHAQPVTNLGPRGPVVELCMKEGGPHSTSDILALSKSDEMGTKLEQELSSAKVNQSSLSGLQILNSVSFAITTTLRSDIQFTALQNVAASEVIPCKYRCRVKVTGISPLSVEDMVKLRCIKCGYLTPIPRNLEFELTDGCKSNLPCTACAAETTHQSNLDIPWLHCIYLFKVKLEDASGSLVAHISGEDALQFLPGIPPTDFHREQRQRYKLIHRLYGLTGGNYPFQTNTAYPRPWIECCLLSYHCNSQNHRSRKVYYHLFDTVLYACGQSA